MFEDGKVRPGGCICEPCLDIPPNWKDIRTKFGYKPLDEIVDFMYHEMSKFLLARGGPND